MKVEILTLRQQFIVIDSDVSFTLVANPVVEYLNGVPQYPSDGNLRGTDYCSRRAGAWQINAWKLLSKQDFPLRPVFTLAIVWDDTDNPKVDIRYSDLNLGEGLAGVNGQLVDIDPETFSPITSVLQSLESSVSSLSSSFNPSVFLAGSFSFEDLDIGNSVTFIGGGSLVSSLPSSRRSYFLESLGFSMLGFTGATDYLGLSKGDLLSFSLEPTGLSVFSFCSVISGGSASLVFDVSKRNYFSFNVSSSDFQNEFAFIQAGFFRLIRIY